MAVKQHDNILCLDIGADSIKAAEFSFAEDGTITLQRFSYEECDFGDISTDNPEYISALNDKVRTLVLSEGYTLKNVNVSISGQNAFIRFDKIPAMTNDMDKIQQILDFEAKQNLPFPVDDIVYSTQLLQATEDDELNAMFVVTKKGEVENVIRNLESIQKRVNIVEVAPTASYNAAHFNGVGENQCEMILNIGGRCSTLIFVDNGHFFLRSFLTAGHAITQQISKEFQIPYKDAEEMKRRHGFVGLGGAYEDPDSEVAATVSKIVRNVMTRLYGEIFRTINVYRTQQKGRKPEKLYLTGGSSVMAYTPRFFEEKLHIPVEYFNPFQSIAMAKGVDCEKLSSVAHLFPEVVGLAMRQVFVCPVSIALIPDSQKHQEDLQTKMPYFYICALALVFCLGLTYWVFVKRFETEYDLSVEAENIWKKTEQIQTSVKKNYEVFTDCQKKYKEASDLFKNSGRWFQIIQAIQRITPEEVWYTEIKAIPSKTTKSQAQATTSTDAFAGFDNPGPMESTTQTAKRDSSELKFLVLRGHILIKKEADSARVQQIYRKLKDSLRTLDLNQPAAKTKDAAQNQPAVLLFDKFSDADADQNFTPAPKGSNISTFYFEIPLKEPIKR